MPTSDLVKERRLRPIYELLDAGYNKKVVQEVDRLLKKSPTFTCAKVLKALAILRLGNRAECWAIINPIFDENPTDDNTIQALSICYRELEEPVKVCQLLENACKVDKSEELLSLCFMANVRISDYQKQHQIALNLFKLYPKVPYFSWAIMSLYAKSVRDQRNDPNKISLPLAERMMAKFIDENKRTITEQDHLLHFYILRQQGNFEKVLEILAGPLKHKASSELSFLHEFQTEGLSKLKKYDELRNYLEEVIMKNMSEWKLYRDYIEHAENIGRERVKKFLEDRLAEDLKVAKKVPYKSLLLANLLLIQSEGGTAAPALSHLDIFDIFITHYSNKPSFFMDLLPFFSLIQQDETQRILHKMKSLLKTPSSLVTMDDIQREINYVYTVRYLLSGSVKGCEKILEQVFLYLEKYLDARDQQVERKTEYSGKEGLPQDEFLFVAALMLGESVWEEASPSWADLAPPVRGDEKRKDRAEELNGDACEANGDEAELTNGLHSFHLDQRQENFSLPLDHVPIFLALAILEYGLQRSPNNPQFRILLSKIYFRCGAAHAAMNVIAALDLKHIQWESLGYLHLWKIRSSGLLAETARAFLYAENFYTSYQKESMEHVLTAYKFGSWDKILEFLDFRDTLTNSLQYALVKVERQLLDLVIKGNSQSQAAQIAQNFTFNLATYWEKVEVLKDCRDVSILLTYSQTRTREEEIATTKKADLERLMIRGLVQSIMGTLIATMDLAREDDKFTEAIELARKETELLTKAAQRQTPEFDLQVGIDGMWAPRINEYKKSRALTLLIQMFQLTLDLVEDPEGRLRAQGPRISQLFHQLLAEEKADWAALRECLFKRADVLEDQFNFVETLSFAVILLDVCKCMIKKSGAISGKGKRRRYKELSKETEVGREFNKVVASLTECFNTAELAIEIFGHFGKSRLPTNWAAMEGFWAGLVSYDLLKSVLPFSMHKVTTKLNSSYGRAIAELLNHFRSKLTYLEAIAISS